MIWVLQKRCMTRVVSSYFRFSRSYSKFWRELVTFIAWTSCIWTLKWALCCCQHCIIYSGIYFHEVSFSYFFLLAWKHPHGVSPKRRDQNLWLWLLPGNRHIQAPVQHVWDAWICCPRNCSPRTSNCGHWYLVSLTATCILDINQILYISLHPDAEPTL